MNFQMNAMMRNLIVTGVILVIAFVAYFALVQPKLAQIAASERQLADLKQQFEDLKRVADQKPAYLALTKQIQQRLTGVELTADPRAYVPTYLKQVEDLARRDGLVVTSVAPQPLPSPSASPGSSPNPRAAENVPIAGQVLKAGEKAAGTQNAVTQATNAVVGPGAPAPGGPAPNPGASPGRMTKSEKPATSRGTKPSTPRENAIAYVNQSFTQVPINMELEGTYNQFQRFLRDLNKFPKLLGVGNVTLVPTGNARVGETPQLKITMPIVAYRLSAGAPARPQNAPAPPRGTSSQGG